LLQYFRINDPYRLLGLLAIMVLINLPFFLDSPAITYPELKSILVGEKVHEGSAIYRELVDSTPPLASWTNGFLDILTGRSLLAKHILAFVIVFFQAAFLGIVFVDKKAFSESTYIPSLIFIILFFFSFDTLALSPELLGSGVLLLALNNLFKEIEFREQRDETIFNLGLFIGLASLFSFSFVVHLAGTITILLIFTRSTVRKYLLMVLGFLLPHFLLMSLYYLNGGLSDFWNFYYVPNLSFSSDSYISTKSLWMLGAIPLFYLVISLVMLNREARFTKYQSQLVQTMFFWMIFSLLQILYSKDFRPQSFITLIPSLSFFIAHYLLLIRRKRLAEISLWILLLGVVSVNLLGRYNKLSSISYQNLLVSDSPSAVTDKKILLLDDNLSVYKSNSLGTSFLNWNLSKAILAEPHYYENVIRVNKSFQGDWPEVIIDPNNLMKHFFKRLPELEKKYSLEKPGVYNLKK
jgi:hypothetical protein